MEIRKNRVGEYYGRWLIVGFSHKAKKHNYWIARCACGTDRTVFFSNLLAGKSKSCGCLNYSNPGRAAHMMSDTRSYKAWVGMKKRCNNKKGRNYKDYGGRGIKVCDRWLNSFDNFYADMGESPPNMSLDRIDNNGNYEPSNCRWATQRKQMNNTRRNVRLTYNGITLNMVEWARRLGISRACLWDRLNRNMPAKAMFSSRKYKACETRNI